MDDYREQAGRRLRELREQRGLSQEELAGAAKLSVKTISRFENGRHDGRRGTLRQLAEALGVSEEVITGPPPAPLGLGVDPEADQIDKIVRYLEAIDARLSRLEDRLEQTIGQRGKQTTEIIDRLEEVQAGVHTGLTQLERALSRNAAAETGRIVEGIEEAWRSGKLPALPPASSTTAAKTAPRRTRRASKQHPA